MKWNARIEGKVLEFRTREGLEVRTLVFAMYVPGFVEGEGLNLYHIHLHNAPTLCRCGTRTAVPYQI